MSGSTSPARVIELLLLVLLGVLLLGHLSIQGYHITTQAPPAERVPWTILVPVYASFSVIGSLYTLGWRRTLAFLSITAVLSFFAEFIGEKTGLIFGNYEYSDVLGWKILGTVPFIIPLAYFMLVYPSYVIVNLILDGEPVSKPGRRFLPGVALLTALIMTAWDLAYDPLMAGEYKAWIWLDGGPFFGIPFQNFVGWVGTCFAIAFLYGIAERRIPLQPMGPPRRWVVLFALAGFAALGVGDVFAGFPEGTRVLAPFTMGIPILAALLRLYNQPVPVKP